MGQSKDNLHLLFNFLVPIFFSRRGIFIHPKVGTLFFTYVPELTKAILTLFSLKSSMEYQVTFVQGMLNLSKIITPAFSSSTINL